MITEIIIEQQRLDLFEDIGAELNYAIDDIKDFSARNTNYSKTINVPGNANNNKVFGHIYNFTSGNIKLVDENGQDNLPNVGYNFDPTKQANCQIFVNKIQVFKGVLRLLEITIQNGVIEYQCAVFGELGGFASAIGNELIEDMDNFNVYNQQWNKNNVVNSWDASGVASGLGIVYPLIDYGNCKHGTNDWHLDSFRPAFFVHEIMHSIITNSKYTYTSAFFDTPYFRSLIIPNNKANLEQLTQDLLRVASNTALDSGSSYGTAGDLVFNVITNLVLFSNTANSSFTFIAPGTNNTLGKIKLSGSVSLSRPGTMTIKLYQSASIVYEETYTTYVDYQQIPIDWLVTTSLDLGDVLSVNATFLASETYVTLDPDLVLEFVSDYAQSANATEGITLNMKHLLPKGIQQKDFFASICRMFNLYVYEDPQKTTHLLIEPYIEFYRRGAGFLKVKRNGRKKSN